MNNDLNCLRDPNDGCILVVNDDSLHSKNGKIYPIVGGIPRFVNVENYSDDFGAQWNIFPKTQLDSFTGSDISESRLARCFGGHLAQVKGKKILEAGSGAGRFTEVLLKKGAIVHSFDYSSAVDANCLNNGKDKNLVLVQADIRKIPFQQETYDYVMCLGVIQHTPNPEESIRSLWQMVRPGGYLVIDHYEWQWRTVLPFGGTRAPLTRQLILRLPRKYRFKFVITLTDFWFPLQWQFKDIPLLRRLLIKISPVAFHYPWVKLRDRQAYYEWALLDTHDATTDFYQHLRTKKQIKKYLDKLGAVDIFVNRAGNGLEAFCRKKL
jgi:SAM-dependent methyltransferase